MTLEELRRVEQEVRQRITMRLDSLVLEELDELQDWLDERESDKRAALIKSINILISDNTLEALEELEAKLVESN